MKALHRFVIALVFSFMIIFPILAAPAFALSDSPEIKISEWEMMWENNLNSTIEDAMSQDKNNDWFSLSSGDGLPVKPAGIQSAWIKFRIPEFNFARPALLISELSSSDLTIYINKKIVHNSSWNIPVNSEIIFPLSLNESYEMVYIKLDSNWNTFGLKGSMAVGEYQNLTKNYMSNGLLDVILGASLVFIATGMLLCLQFIKKSYLTAGNSLSLIILTIGLIILTYSPFVINIYPELAFVSYHTFDIASTLLMPSIYFFFERVFGKGPHHLIYRFKNVQVVFAIINILFFLVSFLSKDIGDWYSFYGALIFMGITVISTVILIVLLIIYCKEKNREAIILTTGFGLFALLAVLEIIWFLIKNRQYSMFYWKWGILFFIGSLVIILVSRNLQNYEQVVKYSKQMEVFNNELQRSEKMEIISQLAASVAHEVRNPLQVTRGFLQLLGEKANNDKDKTYMILAIDELDRASEIITDFLTFAKPQLENTTLLNIGEELQQIEGILVPLATMQGGIIKVDLGSDLYVRGNSSKFKQALINIIKNSIEALGNEGVIHIRAFEDEQSNNVIIQINDNGEGMNESDLKRLGEPYYSKKSKGTGLGLMVTFRIIEVMKGSIHFKSQKGIGTEAILRFPIEIK
ncbi:signal transduction histidine kinase [Paenibacillus castaneae]|uniref:sensor histidine kinase n=1 Tax=Paenibacillus castaneae TaxID=474957 RepID=UPI000C9B6432|nr:sensor histidine kinase [Paenibacillus castaneae]NIK78619.1 signal transduction histidine kinase [Paenibacillus castaneae]